MVTLSVTEPGDCPAIANDVGSTWPLPPPAGSVWPPPLPFPATAGTASTAAMTPSATIEVILIISLLLSVRPERRGRLEFFVGNEPSWPVPWNPWDRYEILVLCCGRHLIGVHLSHAIPLMSHRTRGIPRSAAPIPPFEGSASVRNAEN